jgi:hypothetical protein
MPRGKVNNLNYKLINLTTGKETLYYSKKDIEKEIGLNEYTIRTMVNLSENLTNRKSHVCDKYLKLFRIEKIEPVLNLPS